MKKSIMIILVGTRKGSAPQAQKILTEYGCYIKTRLGIHDGVLQGCTDAGFIILELVGDSKKHKELAVRLNKLLKVKARIIDISIS